MLIPLHDDAAAFTTITFALSGLPPGSLGEGTAVTLLDNQGHPVVPGIVLSRSPGYDEGAFALSVAACLREEDADRIGAVRPRTPAWT
ncbi:MAG: hypothetical protein AAFQ88_11200 [Pseudomonadota bacterium]